MQGHVVNITAEIAGCPAMKCEVAHERCIGGMYWDYNHV